MVDVTWFSMNVELEVVSHFIAVKLPCRPLWKAAWEHHVVHCSLNGLKRWLSSVLGQLSIWMCFECSIFKIFYWPTQGKPASSPWQPETGKTFGASLLKVFFIHTVKSLFSAPALIYFNPCRTTGAKRRTALKRGRRLIFERQIMDLRF